MDPQRGLVDRLRGLNLLDGPRREPAPKRGGAAMPGKPEAVDGGFVHVAESSLPRDHEHGLVRIDVDRERLPAVAAAAARDSRFREIDPSTWVFIDTETTSLNSGAGVWVFMVGIGWFEESEFRIRQFLLVDPGSERALLRAVHRRLEHASAVVSFHGKSFDAPRLDDRFRLAGLDPVLAGRPHLDLLHPMRRLHGHGLPDCRLRTIEQEVLRFVRRDDLPGALCPDAYFAYLRKRPHRLAEVFEHNRLDVLSLSAIAGHLGSAYAGGCPAASALRAGLDWAEAGEAARARDLLKAGARIGPGVPVTVALAAARWLARFGEWDDARRVLSDLALLAPDDPRPRLALNRFERRFRPAVVGASGRAARRGQARRSGASMQT